MTGISRRVQLILFVVLLSLILLAGVAVAVQTRMRISRSAFTFADVETMKVNVRWDASEYDAAYDPSEPAYTAAGNFSVAKGGITMSDVYERADLIVKVKATDDRSFAYQSILTKVGIIEVYKGSPDRSEIYI